MNHKHIQLRILAIILLIQLASGAITVALILPIIFFFRPIERLLSAHWLLLAVALSANMILAAIISVPVIKKILEPLRKLNAANLEVSKGNYDVRLPVPSGEGDFTQIFRSFNLMTEELSNTELFRKDFINSFSHEFKTPIVSIRGFAKQLQLDDSLTEEQREEYIDFIVKESDRLSAMASNILLLSKLENQQYVGEKSTFYLDEQLRHAILLFEKQWTEKGLELDIDLEEAQYTTDEYMLSQIWVNLLSNAMKFAPNGGVVAVKLRKNGEKLVVSIANSGNGIAEKDINRIFEKFYQADSSRNTEGNGLGLALVKRIADLLNLHVSITSEQGKMTVFTVELS